VPGLRKRTTIFIVSGATLLASVFGGPVLSGAIFLLLPDHVQSVEHDLPRGYEPLHKGGVDIPTGLYVREDEDLVVGGTPPLILRRTYLSNYRVSAHSGIGATHNGEIYLHGDLQRISLIVAKGSRITFDRTSAGGSYLNATFEHRSRDEWDSARLGWVGLGWVLRRADDELLLFRGCRSTTVCSIIQSRDPHGHTINYRRDGSGRLARMEAQDRWIAFDYDNRNCIVRASSSGGHIVTYEYDSAGRLSRASGDNGVHHYTYTDRDQIATMEDPGRTIENQYDANGRCIKQIVRTGSESAALTFDFSYRLHGDAVVQTDMARSDGEWSSYAFSQNRSLLSEHWRRPGLEAYVTYERDPETEQATAVTVTCPDRKGLPLRHASVVTDGDEERVKANLLSTHCHWRPVNTNAEKASHATQGPSSLKAASRRLGPCHYRDRGM
jgi:YD repeat-containing protein